MVRAIHSQILMGFTREGKSSEAEKRAENRSEVTTAPSKLALAKALALLAAFLAVLGFSAAVAGLPMSTRELAVALAAAWLATALLGYGLVGGRRAAAAATLLAAIALLALARPQLLPGAEREGGQP
ncbi:MAG: hypothetical protein QXJ16_01585, partial [Desulfurococcaceae archaeon]